MLRIRSRDLKTLILEYSRDCAEDVEDIQYIVFHILFVLSLFTSDLFPYVL